KSLCVFDHMFEVIPRFFHPAMSTIVEASNVSFTFARLSEARVASLTTRYQQRQNHKYKPAQSL
ncbi:MAG: hypothetical protein V7746_24300, partial [Halioglobus sp.]